MIFWNDNKNEKEGSIRRQIGSDICNQYICIVSFKEDHPPLGLWYSCDFKKKIWEILSMHHDIFDYIVWIWDTCFAFYITYQHIKVFPSFLGHLYPAFHGEPKQYLCAECSFRLPILYPRRDNPTCLCISLANNNYFQVSKCSSLSLLLLFYPQ